MSKRVALISVHGDPAVDIGTEEAGGQNVYVLQLGLALAKLGWIVDMFTRQTSAQKPSEVRHASGCRTIRLTAGPLMKVSRDHLYDHLPEFIASFRIFYQENGYAYSVIHSNYWLSGKVGLSLKQILKCPQVHTFHSLGCVKYHEVDEIPQIAATRIRIERQILETADAVIATSPQEMHDMRSMMSQTGNIKVIPCGTDIERFSQVDRTEARQKLKFHEDKKIVLYVGRFDKRKGIETLVRAIDLSKFRSKDLILVIGGGWTAGGPDEAEHKRIRSIVDELELSSVVQFPGRLGISNLHLYYAAADVTVVPSHYEPFGLVAIESMASSTPVITSNVGGLAYTNIHEVTGLQVPLKDPIALAHAIDRILTDDELRVRLGAAARSRVRDYFTWSSCAINMQATYETLMAEH